MAITDGMIATSLERARLHVELVTSYGDDVTLIKPGTKDELGTILDETTLVLQAHPVRFSPFPRITRENISWVENVDVVYYVSKKQTDDLNLTIANIKQYIKSRYKDKEYEIKYVENYMSFAGDFLYVIIGANL